MIGGTITGRSTLSGAFGMNTTPALVGTSIVGKAKLVTGGQIGGAITGRSTITGTIEEANNGIQ